MRLRQPWPEARKQIKYTVRLEMQVLAEVAECVPWAWMNLIKSLPFAKEKEVDPGIVGRMIPGCGHCGCP